MSGTKRGVSVHDDRFPVNFGFPGLPVPPSGLDTDSCLPGEGVPWSRRTASTGYPSSIPSGRQRGTESGPPRMRPSDPTLRSGRVLWGPSKDPGQPPRSGTRAPSTTTDRPRRTVAETLVHHWSTGPQSWTLLRSEAQSVHVTLHPRNSRRMVVDPVAPGEGGRGTGRLESSHRTHKHQGTCHPLPPSS